MRRIGKVTGRSDDMMIVRGVNVFPTQIEELILATPGLSPHFQCVLTRPGRLDELTVRVERRPGADGERRRRPPVRRSQALVKNRIGVTITVRRHRAGRHRTLAGQDAPHHRRTLTAGSQVGSGRSRKARGRHRLTSLDTAVTRKS